MRSPVCSRLRAGHILGWLLSLLVAVWFQPGFGAALAADVPLRFASYNIASSASPGTPRAGLNTILQAMGSESVGGRAQALDLIFLQEVFSQATTTASVVAQMNAIYGAGVYARGTLDGTTTALGTQGIVYNTQKLQLLTEAAIGISSGVGAPRQTLRYQIRVIGAPPSSDFFVYVCHWRQNDNTTDENRRLVDAAALRASADALGSVPIIFTGCLNIYRSTDTGYQTLLAAGNGQAFDPVNRPGSWSSTSSFRDLFTQAPAVTPPTGLTGGGIDDRFDWQLVTGGVLATPTNGGLAFVPGSYHAFGNNGSVPLNGSINAAGNTALAGLANRTTVLNLLTTVSDHLPVVADYTMYITGACCTGTTCTVLAAVACGTSGGIFQGNNSACSVGTGNPTSCCRANFNAVGGLTVQDIFDFLGAWFTGSLAADFNMVGGLTVQDIFDYLGAWFAGC